MRVHRINQMDKKTVCLIKANESIFEFEKSTNGYKSYRENYSIKF